MLAAFSRSRSCCCLFEFPLGYWRLCWWANEFIVRFGEQVIHLTAPAQTSPSPRPPDHTQHKTPQQTPRQTRPSTEPMQSRRLRPMDGESRGQPHVYPFVRPFVCPCPPKTPDCLYDSLCYDTGSVLCTHDNGRVFFSFFSRTAWRLFSPQRSARKGSKKRQPGDKLAPPYRPTAPIGTAVSAIPDGIQARGGMEMGGVLSAFSPVSQHHSGHSSG